MARVTSTTTVGAAPGARRRRAEGAPLGPDSLLWRIAADGRCLMPGTAAGILQLMHPGLGAGVTDHSAFFTEPWDRILRSIPQIWGTIFAPDDATADTRGRVVRDFHTDIKGVDHAGRRYHALDPDVYWWAHATFTWEMFRATELVMAPLTSDEKDQLYAETVTWYRRYGVSERPVPADRAAFEDRFAEICADELERTPAADWVFHMPDDEDAPKPPEAPLPTLVEPARPLLRWLRAENLRLMTYGSMPDVVRRRFDLPWNDADRAVFAGVCTTLRTLGAVAGPGLFDAFFPPGTPHGPPDQG